MSAALKFSTTALNYLCLEGISVEMVETRSLRAGGYYAISLAGYSNIDIQKMVIWIG